MASTCSLLKAPVINPLQDNRRPSLYTSIRVARFVYHIKERLKSRIEQPRRGKINTSNLGRVSLQAEARDCYDWACGRLSYQLPTGGKDGANEQTQHEVPMYVTGYNYHHASTHSLGYCSLLQQLETQASGAEPTIGATALSNPLFLAYDARRAICHKSIDALRSIYDLATSLVARLPSFLKAVVESWWPLGRSTPAPDVFKQENSIANLVHVLRCLRQASLEALISLELKSAEADIQRWHAHWLQGRQLTHGWFLEWPNGRRPLNTTWPWNVRPSLVVLWGVCWMFYDNSTKSVKEMRQQLANYQERASSVAPPATASQQHIATWNNAGLINTFVQAPAWQQAEGVTNFDVRRPNVAPDFSTTVPEYLPTLPTSHSPYISCYPVESEDVISDLSLECHQNRSSYPSYTTFRPLGNSSVHSFAPAQRHSAPCSLPTFSPTPNRWQDPYLSEPQPSLTTSHFREYRIPDQPYALPVQQSNPEEDERAGVPIPSGLQPHMACAQTYPSPHSDVSRDDRRSSCLSVTASNNVSPRMLFAVPPNMSDQSSRPSTGQKPEDPPKNTHGQIICIHPKCAGEGPVFSRKCEWTKHMDKHTRPYICNLPGCEKIRGFTYSGGLARHQREVHRQHGGPKASYMCPHQDCKRSTGSGFSRRENLHEHLRRVHRQVADSEKTPQATTEASAQSAAPTRRRKRRVDDDEDDAEGSPEPFPPEPRKRRKNDGKDIEEDAGKHQGEREDLAMQVKRLRKELQERDERLKKLEQTVELLTKR
ncbi:MAG: hypothetical protein Q9174_003231, partial [Haloplaca sp. 1 TL-2023]